MVLGDIQGQLSVVGRAFIFFYYRCWPLIAAFLVNRSLLAAVARLLLNVLARRNG